MDKMMMEIIFILIGVWIVALLLVRLVILIRRERSRKSNKTTDTLNIPMTSDAPKPEVIKYKKLINIKIYYRDRSLGIYKNGMDGFTIKSTNGIIPKCERSLYNWYCSRESDKYNYYYDKGVIVLNRSDIFALELYTEDIKVEED